MCVCVCICVHNILERKLPPFGIVNIKGGATCCVDHQRRGYSGADTVGQVMLDIRDVHLLINLPSLKCAVYFIF